MSPGPAKLNRTVVLRLLSCAKAPLMRMLCNPSAAQVGVANPWMTPETSFLPDVGMLTCC